MNELEKIARLNPHMVRKVASILDNPLYSSLAGAGIGAGAGAAGALLQKGTPEERKERLKTYIMAGMVAGGGAGATASMLKGVAPAAKPGASTPEPKGGKPSDAAVAPPAKTVPQVAMAHPGFTAGLAAVSPWSTPVWYGLGLSNRNRKIWNANLRAGTTPGGKPMDMEPIRWERTVRPMKDTIPGKLRTGVWALGNIADAAAPGSISNAAALQEQGGPGSWANWAFAPLPSLLAVIHRNRLQMDAGKIPLRGTPEANELSWKALRSGIDWRALDNARQHVLGGDTQ